jgi:hypothetical protein
LGGVIAELGIVGISALGELAPLAELVGAPQHEVDLAGAGCDLAQDVTAQCLDMDRPIIGDTLGEALVVGEQQAAGVVVMEEKEPGEASPSEPARKNAGAGIE